MAELESSLEKKLIEQLCFGESQWTYRNDLRNEEDLWNNFKYILEQNNKAKLNDIPLSDAEFEQIRIKYSFLVFMKLESGWLARMVLCMYMCNVEMRRCI